MNFVIVRLFAVHLNNSSVVDNFTRKCVRSLCVQLHAALSLLSCTRAKRWINYVYCVPPAKWQLVDNSGTEHARNSIVLKWNVRSCICFVIFVAKRFDLMPKFTDLHYLRPLEPWSGCSLHHQWVNKICVNGMICIWHSPRENGDCPISWSETLKTPATSLVVGNDIFEAVQFLFIAKLANERACPTPYTFFEENQ